MKLRRLVLVVLMMAASLWAQAAPKRGPSTPEERKRALQVTKQLENDPLNPKLQQDREWLLRWVIEIPDITVPVCQEVLGVNLKQETWTYKYAPELVGQELAGSAAYMIEHPNETENDYAVYKAGLESALTAYQNIMKGHAKAGRWLPLDELVTKRKNGQLDDYIKQAALKCMSGDLNLAQLR